MHMELDDYVGQPCNSGLAFEFTPKKKTSIVLQDCARKLAASGARIDINTKYVLACSFKGTDISVFKSGKILVKNTADKEQAKEKAEAVLQALE